MDGAGGAGDHVVPSTGLLSLPAEILEHIWLSQQLDHNDICRLAVTCSKFHHISDSNEVWKQKLDKRWPGLLARYPRNENQYYWKDEFRRRGEVGHAIQVQVSGMSRLYIHREEVPRSGFEQLGDTGNPEIARFIIDSLMEICHHKDIHKNLTEKYYAEKALCHVNQLHLQGEWRRFLAQPVEKQHLEKGAVLIAQWCQPTLNITETSVAVSLDAIARQVVTEVLRRHPEHPIAKRNVDDLLEAEVTSADWTPRQSYQILECLNYVLFTQLGFTGNDEDYYDPLNSYINQVLTRRKGIPISLCLIYASVARRLHVVCEPVNFPAHFLLRWLEHPGACITPTHWLSYACTHHAVRVLDRLPQTDHHVVLGLMVPLMGFEDGQEYTYIDVFHQGRFLTEYECSNLLDLHIPDAVIKTNCEAILPIKVFERMARNLVNIGRQQGQMGDGLRCLRNAVELLLTIQPDEMDARILQARLYLHLNINLKEVMEILQGLSAVDRNAPTGLIGYLMLTAGQQLAKQNNEPPVQEIVPKFRSACPEVAFSIGIIARHKRYNYTCVVYGWDAECEATQEWIVQMGVNNLPRQKYQPFYNVLVEDGSNRYAAQENLELAPEPKVITHPEVGRYFAEYRGTHYLPNTEKLSQYPEDMEMTQRYTADKYG